MRQRPNYELIYQYIIDSIDSEDTDLTNATNSEKLQFLYDTFFDEIIRWKKKPVNQCEALANHIGGLPSYFNIEFRNHKIIELAKLWNSIPEEATEKQKDMILQNWFNFIAVNTFKLFKKYKINLKP